MRQATRGDIEELPLKLQAFMFNT